MVEPGLYRHFKGGLYQVLDTAKHSETLEEMVVYRALYGNHGLWVRPAAMWDETVTREGRTFRRFSPVPPYRFYGWAWADVPPLSPADADLRDPRMLYDRLMTCWCAETCAPRMRADWSPANPTLGQCSITAFLAQDIYGGRVYGVPLPDGNFHCFNVVGDRVFDLTSEQFGDTVLDYTDCPEQFREVHFAKAEKAARYRLLKEKLSGAVMALRPGS